MGNKRRVRVPSSDGQKLRSHSWEYLVQDCILVPRCLLQLPIDMSVLAPLSFHKSMLYPITAQDGVATIDICKPRNITVPSSKAGLPYRRARSGNFTHAQTRFTCGRAWAVESVVSMFFLRCRGRYIKPRILTLMTV